MSLAIVGAVGLSNSIGVAYWKRALDIKRSAEQSPPIKERLFPPAGSSPPKRQLLLAAARREPGQF
ncbi:MAG: hypothetical protein KJ064_16995 [Anaerolineae bacterium]|nr:hypothetical protein [Anaerolineae bacterium]